MPLPLTNRPLPGSRVVVRFSATGSPRTYVCQTKPRTVRPANGDQPAFETTSASRISHCPSRSTEHEVGIGTDLEVESVRPDVGGEAEVDIRTRVEVVDLRAQVIGVQHRPRMGVFDNVATPAATVAALPVGKSSRSGATGSMKCTCASRPRRLHLLGKRGDAAVGHVEVAAPAAGRRHNGASFNSEIEHRCGSSTCRVRRSRWSRGRPQPSQRSIAKHMPDSRSDPSQKQRLSATDRAGDRKAVTA